MTQSAVTLPRVGILGMGDMGAAIARALVARGVPVATTLEGRSDDSRSRAEASGARILSSLQEVIDSCEIFLSVVPPASADALAGDVAQRLDPDRKIIFADCNAITPDHAQRLAGSIEAAGGVFVDGGIIGPPPGVGTPRLYVSGDAARELQAFDGMGFAVRPLRGPAGRASALKLLFAGLNKGFNALSATMLIAGEKLDMGDALESEIETMLPGLADRMQNQIPYLPVNAARWVAEMKEIAALLSELDLPSGFHDGAAETFDLINRHYGSGETRETYDASRSARDVARTCAGGNGK